MTLSRSQIKQFIGMLLNDRVNLHVDSRQNFPLMKALWAVPISEHQKYVEM